MSYYGEIRPGLTSPYLSTGDEFRDSVFVKRQPKSTVRRDLFNTEDCFTNEVTMYEHVLNDLTLPCARSFYATKELIILEDLRTSGYAMVERRSGLCVDDAARVLKVFRLTNIWLSFCMSL